MLFTMVEKGMDGDVLGDKGKIRNNPSNSAKTLSLAGGTNINTSVSPSSSKGTEALWAVLLTKELWRKGVWNDAKSVSIVSLGCFHPVAKVQSASLHFFLGDEEDDNENDSSDSEDEGPNMRSLQHKRGINKKTRSGDKKFEKAGKIAKKKRKERAEETTPNFPAIQLLNDPQSFGEKLYEGLVKYGE
jgi:protein SDA1